MKAPGVAIKWFETTSMISVLPAFRSNIYNGFRHFFHFELSGHLKLV